MWYAILKTEFQAFKVLFRSFQAVIGVAGLCFVFPVIPCTLRGDLSNTPMHFISGVSSPQTGMIFAPLTHIKPKRSEALSKKNSSLSPPCSWLPLCYGSQLSPSRLVPAFLTRRPSAGLGIISFFHVSMRPCAMKISSSRVLGPL